MPSLLHSTQQQCSSKRAVFEEGAKGNVFLSDCMVGVWTVFIIMV